MSEDDTPFHDGMRIGGKREMAAQKTIKLCHLLMAAGCAEMKEPEPKVALMAGLSMVPLAGISMAFGSEEEYKGREGTFAPTMDEIQFGAYYVLSALERHPHGVIASFSIEAIVNALRLFKEATGRDYEGLCKVLQDATAEWVRRSKEVPDSIKQFMPE